MAETRRHTPPNDVLSGIKRILFRLSMYGVYMLFLWIGYANSHGWKAICTCLCDVYADQQRETVRIVSRIISFANFATYMYMDFWFGLTVGKSGWQRGGYGCYKLPGPGLCRRILVGI